MLTQHKYNCLIFKKIKVGSASVKPLHNPELTHGMLEIRRPGIQLMGIFFYPFFFCIIY